MRSLKVSIQCMVTTRSGLIMTPEVLDGWLADILTLQFARSRSETAGAAWRILVQNQLAVVLGMAEVFVAVLLVAISHVEFQLVALLSVL